MRAKFFGNKIKTVVAFGSSIYLFNEIKNYWDLLEVMEGFKVDEEKKMDQPIVEASEKEYLLIGAHAPSHARPSKTYLKQSMFLQIDNSPLKLKYLAVRLDNEKHYELYAGGEFVVELFTSEKTPKLKIKPDNMLGINLCSINSHDLFEVGFARKPAFIDKIKNSSLMHEALALRLVSGKKSVSLNSVVCTGAEIQQIISKVNKSISEKQHCDMYHSNCCSSAVALVAELIKTLDARNDNYERNSADIKTVTSIFATSEYALANYGRGIANNPEIMRQLNEVTLILKKRHLLVKKEQKTFDRIF